MWIFARPKKTHEPRTGCKVFGPIVPYMVHLGESNLRPFWKSFSGTQNQPKGTLIFFFTEKQNKKGDICLCSHWTLVESYDGKYFSRTV